MKSKIIQTTTRRHYDHEVRKRMKKGWRCQSMESGCQMYSPGRQVRLTTLLLAVAGACTVVFGIGFLFLFLAMLNHLMTPKEEIVTIIKPEFCS